MYLPDIRADAYIKFKAPAHLLSLTPSSVADLEDDALSSEILALQDIKPHAIITTNYDCFLELAFPDYIPIIGQNIISGSSISVGEILKIHGRVSQPNSLVLTQSDYDDFIKRKKYLSAKLLTCFSEHPLLFASYSASDPNIRAILSDIDEALPVAGALIPNVYIVEWQRSLPKDHHPVREK
jgi:SIR2-like domain